MTLKTRAWSSPKDGNKHQAFAEKRFPSLLVTAKLSLRRPNCRLSEMGSLYQLKERVYFPKRCIFMILGFFGTFLLYATRVNLSVAIVAMVNDSEHHEFNPFNNSVKCYNQLRNDTHPAKNVQKGMKYNWDSKIQGLILSSAYYGFFFTQLPGGILSERIGAKWIYGSGVLISNVLYLLLPFAASLGYEVFIAIRVIEGFAEGLTFPAINFAISNWSPKSERSRISSIIFLGIPFGMIIGMTVSGVLSSTEFLGGWPSTFYLFGSCGILWFIFWSTLVYETPKDHPYISAEELAYIQDGQTESFTVLHENNNNRKPVVPWKDIFSSLPVWAVIIAHLGNAYALVLLLAEMPTYFRQVLQLDIQTDGLLSAIPYVCQIVSSAASSYIADRLRMSNKISITSIRKIMNSIERDKRKSLTGFNFGF
ncbi:hypothetical protein CDAR_114891 [Caerostris darwini]|uniref:Major facilitator superfamily (MFS) profile domain-containing protein n=1 Tax=Caerostris darwini TaxID=1538125 RepID=A0AAV4QYG9_9ARAC|nr:hypothetical protein CDAR_114891 [Caerostris darwini]